jgi:alcohol dehydrogenase (cytochrome c)
MKIKSTAGLAAFTGALLTSTSAVRAADVTFERLLNPEPHNWLMVHHDYNAQRFSTLETINKSNIKNMKLLFAVAIGGTSPNEALEATPLVDDGFMYVVDGWGAVYKIDVRSGTQGRILWKMDPGQEKYGRIRGVALWGNLVISTTGKDGRVIATDKDSGKIVWDKNLHDQPEVELSSAPLALKDEIIVGASGGDQGVCATGSSRSIRRPAT